MNMPSLIRPPVQPRTPLKPPGTLAQGAVTDPFGLSSGSAPPGEPGYQNPLKPPTLFSHQPGQKPFTAAIAQPQGSMYDLSTDPAVAAQTAYGTMADQQAQAAALRARQQSLLGYGDPALAQAVLGDGTWAGLAGNNPNSTLAQLARTRDQNLKTLDDGLNANNLIYSGNRVVQETQQAQDYQSALAQAAAQEQSALGGIDSTLTGALQGTQQQNIQAIDDAATRAMNNAVTTGIDPGKVTYDTGHPTAPAPAKKTAPSKLTQAVTLPKGLVSRKFVQGRLD